jgi:hypothetical protein
MFNLPSYPIHFCRATLYTFAELPYTRTQVSIFSSRICRPTLHSHPERTSLYVVYRPTLHIHYLEFPLWENLPTYPIHFC